MDCSTPGFPSPTPEVSSNSCPLSCWCHPTISSSAVPFSSCLQTFPASGSFPMSQFFPSGGQWILMNIPMNIQDRFPLGSTGWISLLSKGLSRVFSNTTVQKHQFFGAQLSLWSTALSDQWNYEPCCVGPPKTDGSWWWVLTKRGPLEKGMANHFSILALRTSWTVWKGKNIWHWKMNSPD